VRIPAAALVLIGTIASGLPAFAQGRFLKGTVTDSANNRPIEGALVYLDREAAAVTTGKDGAFRVPATVHDVTVALRRPGYIPIMMAAPADSAASETDLGVRYMRQVKSDADRDAVREVDIQMFPQLVAFYDRRAKNPLGAFLTPDEVQRSAGPLTEVIRQKPGFQNICVPNRQRQLDCGRKSDRGPTTIMGSGRPGNAVQQMCFVRVWTDAVGPERTLDAIRMDEVLAVEAYPTTSSTPREFPGSSCATVRLWMKSANLTVPHQFGR
jgi:hypothetical protein